MTLDDILEEVSKYRTRLVEITGGEPLEQDGVYALMETLVAGGFTVMVETGGQVPLNRVPAGVVKIIDVKCPDSGECGTFASGNLDLAADTDEFKFVLASRTDYEWARAFCRERLAGKPQTILFSPVHGTLDPSDLSGWVLSDGLDVRVQLQIHKHIWGAAARGV
jgi:7-carboxy-7-deazaguanine synthase